MHLSESQWSEFYAGFKRLAGLDLHQYKADQMRRRISGMLQAKNMTSLSEFEKWLIASPANVEWFQDKLAINVSELFRNPDKWREMEQVVLPQLIKQSSTLNCWSAGCSYGAEAHTLATIFAAKFPGRHKILGTDIDQAALAQAKAGEFAESDMKQVPVAFRSKYFSQDGAIWRASQEIRSYCRFATANILEKPTHTSFDLIMCRNVVIYFTEQAKEQLYSRFFNALKPGGILFVGSTERIFKSKEIGFETPYPFFYRKPTDGGKEWRNAS